MANQLARHRAAGLVCGLLVLLVSTGCSSTRVASTGNEIATINLLAERRVAQVALAGGEVFRARALLIETDSVSWVDARTGEFKMAATPQVREVRFTSRRQGALDGAGLAAAVGGTALAIIAAVMWEPCRGWICIGPDSPGGAAVWGAVAGAVAGLPLGAILGVAVGSRRTYEIQGPDGVTGLASAAQEP